jgi:hypothetical protein
MANSRDRDDSLICPVCNEVIVVREPTGSLDGEPAHLACWIARRDSPSRPEAAD